jgi:acyl-CoA thioesterase YciA
VTKTRQYQTYPHDKQPAIRVSLMPRDTNALGTIFGGVILSYIDQAAAIEAHTLHVGKLVTVAMDQVEFRQPVFVGDLVSFFADIERVGTSSIRVLVSVWARRASDRSLYVPVTEARVTLVAVDDHLRPTPVLRPPAGDGGR